MHRRAVALLLAAVLGPGLAGCSDDEAPERATPTAEFCAAASKLEQAGDDFAAVRRAARQWQQVGVPDDAPKNVDRGVRIGLSILRRAKSPRQVERLVNLLSPQEQDDVNAVDRYLAEECTG
jgi:hypothetical protein